jgi:hypothetical protein
MTAPIAEPLSREIPEDRRDTVPDAVDAHGRRVFRDRPARQAQREDLRDREEADQRRHERHTVPEIVDAEREAHIAADVVVADEREHQAECRREQPADHPAFGRGRDRAQAEHAEHEELGRPEAQNHLPRDGQNQE